MAKDSKASKDSTQPVRRIYKGKEQVVHDLFILKPALFKKNVSWTEDRVYEDVSHQHIYHSVDSSGKPQMTCSPIGGHFHEITLIKSEDGAPPLAKCSTPKKIIKNRRGQKITVDLNPDDQHTHEVEYRDTQVLQPRKLNAEAAKHQAMEAQKESSIPGVQG